MRWVGVATEGMYIGGAFSSVGGSPRRNLARLTAAGTLDTGFDSSNGANGIVNAGAVQADGKLLIAGNFTSYNGPSCPRIARINTVTSIDSSFNPSSGANGEVFSLKMLEDGRIILTGSFTAFNNQPCNGTMRLMPDGSPDPTIAPSALTVDSSNQTPPIERITDLQRPPSRPLRCLWQAERIDFGHVKRRLNPHRYESLHALHETIHPPAYSRPR